jgi:hypothetical protein
MSVNKKVREELKCNKWLNAKEGLACKKITKFINITELKIIRKCLFKISSKWKNRF